MIVRPMSVLAALTGLLVGCPVTVEDHYRVGSLAASATDGEAGAEGIAEGGSAGVTPETADDPPANGTGAGGDPSGSPDGVGCLDGKRDGTETDKDCGGGACAPCPDGKHCLVDTDCRSGNCKALRCAAH